MDTSVFHDALVREKQALLEELKSLGALDHTITGDWVSTPEEAVETEADDNVVADRVEAAIERDGELAVFEIKLSLVEHALAKIAAGTYGTCELCGTPIEQERLTINPAARTCVSHRDDERDLEA